MKILVIMCDMLRPNILNMDSANYPFESLLKQMGGTYYTNCFSQGPDTGRSLGCFWSGKIPQDNGCDMRNKYPKFYMNCKSFLDTLKDKQYSFYFFTNPNEKILGILPEGYDQIGIHNKNLDLSSFVKEINLSEENIYVHLTLTDFHWALDDRGSNVEGVKNGLRILHESLTNIFSEISLNVFDFVLIFSDHGFKYDYEFRKQEKYLLLNRDRCNTLMFIHKKGEHAFSLNDKLCSMIDVYPTVMDLLKEDYMGYGHSLFSNTEPEYIISEDHLSFSPQVYQPIELWALIKKEVIYLRTIDGHYRDDGESFNLNYDNFDQQLCDNSISFKDVYKKIRLLKLYEKMANDKSFYTNGEKRYIIRKANIVKRLKRKILSHFIF